MSEKTDLRSPLSRRELIRRVKRSIRIMLYGDDLRERPLTQLTESELEQIRAFFPQPKFFVLGHARSGTTLLARLLRLHPEVHCDWQAHFFSRPPFVTSLIRDATVEEWLSRRSNRWNHGKDYSTVLIRSVCDYLLERESHALGKIIVGDKSPNNLVHGDAVKRMHLIYPDARLIFIVRDGRDAALSHVLQGYMDHPDRLPANERKIRRDFIKDPKPYFERKRSLFTPKTLHARAQDWMRNLHETIQLGELLYCDRFYHLRFEDLISDPNSELEALWKFLNASKSTVNLQQSILDEMSIKPDESRRLALLPALENLKRKGPSGAWKELFTDGDISLFHDIAGEKLQDFGYSTEIP